mgnify:CR=1 FL=1
MRRFQKLLVLACLGAVLVVPGTPAKAGIDPLTKLIDRDAEDNLAAVAGR